MRNKQPKPTAPACLLTQDQKAAVLSSRCVKDNTMENKVIPGVTPKITGGVSADRNEFKFMVRDPLNLVHALFWDSYRCKARVKLPNN